MKKFIILLLLFLIPLKTFAVEQPDKYFNFIFHDNFQTDVSSNSTIMFGGNTTLTDFIAELRSYNNTYRNLVIILQYTNIGFSKIVIGLIPKNATMSVSVYGILSGDSMSPYINYIASVNSLRFVFSKDTGSTSVLDSVTLASIKACMETDVCPTTKPTESSYTGSITFTRNYSNFSFNDFIANFDSTLDYELNFAGILYYSDVPVLLVPNTNTDYYHRTTKYMGNTIELYDNFPSYIDYLLQPDDPTPDPTPDPEPDSDVGVWKNYVMWFVDYDSEYGVLVNIYILLFISIIGFSFIYFITFIKKSRW